MSLREEFVLRALEPNTKLAPLCRAYGISRKTGYKWIERYKKGGVVALNDLSRKPRSSPLRIDADTVADIVAVRNAHPTWGARKIMWALHRSGCPSVPSERTINRVLERCGLIVRRSRRPKPRHASAKPNIEVNGPNDLWTADYKGWWKTGDRRRCEPLTVRDHFSRFVLAVHITKSPFMSEAEAVFDRLFELYGLPANILTDNGSPFVAVHSKFGLTQLSAWWLKLGIEHHRTRRGKPSDNGGHERMHRDMALELEALPAPTVQAQQVACDQWRLDFNNNRPHEALGMRTPAELYTPSPNTYTGKQVETVYPEYMLVRTVSGGGFIRINNKQIQISQVFRRQQVGIDPREGPSYPLWFAHRRIGWIDLDNPKPKVVADTPTRLTHEEVARLGKQGS